MDRTRLIAAACIAALVSTTTLAQGGPGGAPGPGPGAGMMGSGPGASAPGPGMRRGAMGGSMYTPGWALMTQKERNEHHEHMRAMTNYDECKTYMEQHREQMAARAKEKGGKALAQPRRDACAGLKP